MYIINKLDFVFSAVNQKNSNVIDDFSQIEITDKKDNQATLTAKKDSKSYQGSVVITYNVVPTTMVDLKIDLKSTAPDAIVVKDYVGQIDKTIITNPVNSFYYANSESKITMIKPTASSVITGMVYGCDQQWINSTIPPKVIDSTNGIVLDGSQLSTNNGKYIIELQDNLGNQNKIYLQINKVKTIPNYFDTEFLRPKMRYYYCTLNWVIGGALNLLQIRLLLRLFNNLCFFVLQSY